MSTTQTDARLQRGAEWRKWDLHIHSPLSALNNQFPKEPDGSARWEAYLAKLESLTDIPAIGITDYFTVEGYKRIVAFRQAGRIGNFSLVLPNIEFRLDKVVASSKDGGSPRRLNAHVVFSDEVPVADIEEHFLRELKFSAIGSPGTTDEKRSCTPHQLAELPSILKSQHDKFKDRSDLERCRRAQAGLRSALPGYGKTSRDTRLYRYFLGADHRGEHNVPARLHHSQERSQSWRRGCGLAKLSGDLFNDQNHHNRSRRVRSAAIPSTPGSSGRSCAVALKVH